MKRNLLKSALCCLLSLIGLSAMAQQRRPIDNEHPMWLVHVDVWNQADPQKIIDLIPADIKPYVVMNLSLSCAYDKDLDMYQRPQNAIRTYKSWASVCQANNMWFCCQPASGGHTHIQDDDVEIFEYFYKTYPNFLGWNYAEQFWGFNEAGDKSSSSDVTRIALFAKLVRMAHQYGGFLTVSFCGNVWSHPLNPVGMMKRNPELLQACRDYPEAILWLYKYTTSSCFYNNESVTFSPFISGLAANYGVRYDNCGWNGATSDLVGENKCTYPVAAGIGTVMEQTCVNGGAVWDGPELIWTEDFQNLSNTTTADGFSRRRWGTFPGFRNAWLDMWGKIIDGTMYIPSRREVVEKTKIVVINDVTSGNDEDKYASWGSLYDGLYKQTDPFNRNNGQWMDNYCYFKKTGRYGAIPVCIELADELAQSIPVKVKKSQRNTVWPNETTKTNKFKDMYPLQSVGTMYVNRFHNQLVTYTPYSYLNSNRTSWSRIPLEYNTCDSLRLTWGMLSSAIIHEDAEGIDFYLNNYRSDTTARVNDVITIVGAIEEPTYTYKKRAETNYTVPVPSWDAEKGLFTLTVSHNGPLEIRINCHGNNTENRRTDVVSKTKLELPKQPEQHLLAPVIIEAEDMDYKSVANSVNNAYFTGYRNYRGHSGNGFVDMGTNTAGVLKCYPIIPAGGTYRVGIRYSNRSSKTGKVKITRTGQRAVTVDIETCENNEWKKAWAEIKLTEDVNTLTIANSQGISMYIDQIICIPAELEDEKFDVNIRTVEHGYATASSEQAAEGTVVTLTAHPEEGFALKGWRCIHGSVTVSADNTFTMPDDIVTLEPIFEDVSTIYELDFSTSANSNIPYGWRCDQGEIHEYPNSYSSGARLFTGFTGYAGKALYWRDGYAAYGYQNAYKLHLEPGDYKLMTVMAAWKGSPTYKAQILKSNGSVVKESSSQTAAPNANGSASANLSSAQTKTMTFTIAEAGDYIIKYQMTSSGGMQEYLLAGCSLHTVPDPSAIEQIDALDDDATLIFDLMGRPAAEGQKGITIKQGKLIMIR